MANYSKIKFNYWILIHHHGHLSHGSTHLRLDNCRRISESFWDRNLCDNWLEFILDPETEWSDFVCRDLMCCRRCWRFWFLFIFLGIFFKFIDIFWDFLEITFDIHKLHALVIADCGEDHLININVGVNNRNASALEWFNERGCLSCILST